MTINKFEIEEALKSLVYKNELAENRIYTLEAKIDLLTNELEDFKERINDRLSNLKVQ